MGPGLQKHLKWEFNNPLLFKLELNQIPHIPKSSQQGFLHARHRSPYKSNSLQNHFILQRYIPKADPIRSQALQNPPNMDFQGMGHGLQKKLNGILVIHCPKSIQIPYHPKLSQQGVFTCSASFPCKSNSLQNLFILQR